MAKRKCRTSNVTHSRCYTLLIDLLFALIVGSLGIFICYSMSQSSMIAMPNFSQTQGPHTSNVSPTMLTYAPSTSSRHLAFPSLPQTPPCPPAEMPSSLRSTHLPFSLTTFALYNTTHAVITAPLYSALSSTVPHVLSTHTARAHSLFPFLTVPAMLTARALVYLLTHLPSDLFL